MQTHHDFSEKQNDSISNNDIKLYMQNLIQFHKELLPIDEIESKEITQSNNQMTESVINLYKKYGIRLSNETCKSQIHEEIIDWAKTVDVSNEEKMVTPTIAYIDKIDSYYLEPISLISLRQFISLIWLAIHDDKYRIGNKNDALVLFAEVLSQMQNDLNSKMESIIKNKNATDQNTLSNQFGLFRHQIDYSDETDCSALDLSNLKYERG